MQWGQGWRTRGGPSGRTRFRVGGPAPWTRGPVCLESEPLRNPRFLSPGSQLRSTPNVPSLVACPSSWPSALDFPSSPSQGALPPSAPPLVWVVCSWPPLVPRAGRALLEAECLPAGQAGRSPASHPGPRPAPALRPWKPFPSGQHCRLPVGLWPPLASAHSCWVVEQVPTGEGRVGFPSLFGAPPSAPCLVPQVPLHAFADQSHLSLGGICCILTMCWTVGTCR